MRSFTVGALSPRCNLCFEARTHRTRLQAHPFHVIDEEVAILSVDHPFVPEGRVASLMVRDAALAKRLADGFETLWAKAMRSLREIAFQPGQ